MSDAPTRILQLTRTQKKVLADLELFSDDGEHVAISHRKLAESTGLSRPTVLTAIEALNDLRLITTCPRKPREPGRYRLLFPVSVRTASGQISPLAKRSSTGGGAR
ncbi:MAG TPA: helix-turn-helix domain-containing protein [Bryobacteraceae bacterium]|nr:helix-turn-helix domain-containing protein [Bryobacteraceae bacterium]